MTKKALETAVRELRRAQKTVAEMMEDLTAYDSHGEPMMKGFTALISALHSVRSGFEQALKDRPEQQDLPF